MTEWILAWKTKVNILTSQNLFPYNPTQETEIIPIIELIQTFPCKYFQIMFKSSPLSHVKALKAIEWGERACLLHHAVADDNGFLELLFPSMPLLNQQLFTGVGSCPVKVPQGTDHVIPRSKAFNKTHFHSLKVWANNPCSFSFIVNSQQTTFLQL